MMPVLEWHRKHADSVRIIENDKNFKKPPKLSIVLQLFWLEL